MKDNAYNTALQEFNERISQRKKDHQHKIDILNGKIPQLKIIGDGINKAGLKLTIASVSEGNPTDLKKYREEIELLKSDQISLLESEGYPKDYLDYKPICPICNDQGVVNGERCVCFNKLLVEKYYDQSNLKNILDKENFDNFNTGYYSDSKGSYPASPKLNIQNILLAAINYANNFKSEKTNLYFFGDPGLGKTFLSHCIAKEVLDKGFIVIYQTSSELLDIIRRSKFQNPTDSTQDNPVNYLYSCDLLIIDDLGTETLTDFANNELFNLINKRLKDEKKMIISTNLSLDKLEDRYSARLASRIIGNFRFFEFFGEDIRMKKADII
ncbi:ATP-binding protein [Alkalibacter mobilis]|uniref:ATP-binding protein n=1 Tax=Alkalibacter mobilis TaxID=2787712 RepID=UPI00189D7CAF|nr:ATP-binding protein [Alkalibacter mobilis]MBF7096703.1 ATP-binding protein [Alkalibacter mobilis]